MIARIWHGEVASERADEYLDHLNRTGVPDYRATGGNRGVHVLRRLNEDRAHFLAVSLWESMQKIEGLAGADPREGQVLSGGRAVPAPLRSCGRTSRDSGWAVAGAIGG